MNLGPGIQTTELPNDFYCSGVNSGVRRYRPDLGLIFSKTPAHTFAVFTKNKLKAAPLVYAAGILPSDKLQAIVTNSGQANAATGAAGMADNLKYVNAVAEILELTPEQVVTCSTGVIGERLKLDKIIAALPELKSRQLSKAEPFALAILTTDLVPKSASMTVHLSEGPVLLTGICKGSGMIHPNMATMLGYLLTDAIIPMDKGLGLLQETVDDSFNMISVDGDTSTNDSVFLMANGTSGIAPKTAEDWVSLKQALLEMSILLAKSIAKDGEGATKLLEVVVTGCESQRVAVQITRDMLLSPLIKTAIHGEDPNWGRIISRLGALDLAPEYIEQVELHIQDQLIYGASRAHSFDAAKMKKGLASDEIQLELKFNKGPFKATGWGCDLSKKYVEINAEYTT